MFLLFLSSAGLSTLLVLETNNEKYGMVNISIFWLLSALCYIFKGF